MSDQKQQQEVLDEPQDDVLDLDFKFTDDTEFKLLQVVFGPNKDDLSDLMDELDESALDLIEQQNQVYYRQGLHDSRQACTRIMVKWLIRRKAIKKSSAEKIHREIYGVLVNESSDIIDKIREDRRQSD